VIAAGAKRFFVTIGDVENVYPRRNVNEVVPTLSHFAAVSTPVRYSERATRSLGDDGAKNVWTALEVEAKRIPRRMHGHTVCEMRISEKEVRLHRLTDLALSFANRTRRSIAPHECPARLVSAAEPYLARATLRTLRHGTLL
jgi:hypothetical protein